MPEVKSIYKATAVELYKRWQSWVVFTTAFCFSAIIGLWLGAGAKITIFTPLIIIILYAGFVQGQVRTLFWKQFALLNGWQYKSDSDPSAERGIMFRQGNNRNISNCIEGILDKRCFRIFTYNFSTGSGKNKRAYYYTVFSFKFSGTFPNIYLNNKNNSCDIKAGEAIPLPEEFEKSFTLSAPKDYEIEALEIFTPDVLASLLDNKFNHDVEFVNQEMLIFSDGRINNSEQLGNELRRALELEDLFDEKLDKFKMEKIGDMPTKL